MVQLKNHSIKKKRSSHVSMRSLLTLFSRICWKLTWLILPLSLCSPNFKQAWKDQLNPSHLVNKACILSMKLAFHFENLDQLNGTPDRSGPTNNAGPFWVSSLHRKGRGNWADGRRLTVLATNQLGMKSGSKIRMNFWQNRSIIICSFKLNDERHSSATPKMSPIC